MGDKMFIISFLVAYYIGVIHGKRTLKVKEKPKKYSWACKVRGCGLVIQSENFDFIRRVVVDHCQRHLNTMETRRVCLCTENTIVNDLPHEPNCPMSKQEH